MWRAGLMTGTVIEMRRGWKCPSLRGLRSRPSRLLALLLLRCGTWWAVVVEDGVEWECGRGAIADLDL